MLTSKSEFVFFSKKFEIPEEANFKTMKSDLVWEQKIQTSKFYKRNLISEVNIFKISTTFKNRLEELISGTNKRVLKTSIMLIDVKRLLDIWLAKNPLTWKFYCKHNEPLLVTFFRTELKIWGSKTNLTSQILEIKYLK